VDTFGQPLTNSCFPAGDGEKRPPVIATDAHIWPAMANTETNGETENPRNVGQLGTWEKAMQSTNCGENVAGNGIGSPRATQIRTRFWRTRRSPNSPSG